MELAVASQLGWRDLERGQRIRVLDLRGATRYRRQAATERDGSAGRGRRLLLPMGLALPAWQPALGAPDAARPGGQLPRWQAVGWRVPVGCSGR